MRVVGGLPWVERTLGEKEETVRVNWQKVYRPGERCRRRLIPICGAGERLLGC